MYEKALKEIDPKVVPAYLNQKQTGTITSIRDYAVIEIGETEYTMSGHVMYERSKERYVNRDDMVDALSNPLYVEPNIRYNDKGNPSRRYIGSRATLNVNPETNVITTVWKTGRKAIRKYRNGRI